MSTAEERQAMGEKASGPMAFIYNEQFRSIVYQLFTFLVVGWMAWYLFSNTTSNMAARGMNSGFSFLGESAGFDTDFKLIPYEPGDTYGRIFWVGVTNTLFVSVFSIILTTILGFVVGVMRLSNNWLVAKLASAYVEILRNTPLLIQIIFWYLGVFSLLPRPKQSLDLFGAGLSFLNNRGFYVPWPEPGDLFWMTVVAFFIGCIAAYFMSRWAHKRQDDTGQQFPSFWAGVGLILGLPLLVFLVTGMPLGWDIPALKGFNFAGGGRIPPALLTMMVALTIYHSSYIGEMVRAGIESVHKGQTEASNSLGLRANRTLQLVIIPQAMRAIIPPLISTWMNVVKNSSLAVAVGYPEIVSLFMQTSLNQSGYAIEIVGMTMLFYMVISLSISVGMNYYNKRVQIKER
jgi:general L-amino acid transport system permease protein